MSVIPQNRKRKRNVENRQVYVGNMPFDATEKEIEAVFSVMGPIKSIWMAKRPPGFAFVTFKRTVHAFDAVKYLNGKKICDLEAKVEMCEVDFKEDLRRRMELENLKRQNI
ncbi:RRM domain-containing protein [Caenorhabditis elegans]|uniref:RRM domain-containing protein n=1 Tax=Caenorhabditis elegans TaxID=6239 RepID=O18219_CAEEL|nr:RRM domain-containing protein [Caenorhabditis elegans]CAB16494.2 RRM domain-containing protein [Caenorhabditis elegans]|eukprot:NP_502757.2 Uncharacterized protein CELE_Y57G11A.5 [Caenorhabditis elegans]